MTDLTDKTILMVVAPLNFRDEELFVPKEFFEKKGINVIVASRDGGVATGMLGGSINVDIRVSDADASNYDAVVFVGGSGIDSQVLYEDPGYLKLAKDANDADKLVSHPLRGDAPQQISQPGDRFPQAGLQPQAQRGAKPHGPQEPHRILTESLKRVNGRAKEPVAKVPEALPGRIEYVRLLHTPPEPGHIRIQAVHREIAAP